MRVKKRHAQNAHFFFFIKKLKVFKKSAYIFFVNFDALIVNYVFFIYVESCQIFFELKTYIVYALSCYT
jgi:hypothetical protein